MYLVSDRLLYEVGKEIGRDWKKVARRLGLTSLDMKNVKMKAKSSRKRAWKMLQLWHSRMRRDIRVNEISIKSKLLHSFSLTVTDCFSCVRSNIP